MGCYGIGVSRTVAAAIEQNHDENGIIFPLPLAPFQVIILNLDPRTEEITEAAESMYRQLQQGGLDVLLDDRDERPGIKFKDADLIGIPYRITIGKRYLQEGEVEVRTRADGNTQSLSLKRALAEVVGAVRNEMAATREPGIE
jgi:prolyl-tRNA synthetase